MDLETLNNNLPGHVILNMADRREIQTRQAIELLSNSSISVSPYLSRLRDYRASMNDGRTAQEIAPDGRASLEVAELWKYVDTELRRIK
jgi:chromosome partitioning protein